MSRGILLFVESNTSGTGRLFVRSARALGFRPVLITARPDAYAWQSTDSALEATDSAPEIIVVRDADEDSLEPLIRSRFADGGHLAGITSSSEYYVATAAALAARFGLPGPDARSVRLARNKAWQREMLAADGLPTPCFRVVSSPRDAVAAARVIGPPVVVKPLRGSGSLGVRACVSAAEAGRHAALLLSRTAAPDERSVLVEMLIEGPEFSVEVFSGQIVGITRKHVGAPPWFVETGHDYPAIVPHDVGRTLTKTVTQATRRLGLTWGPLHWELRIRDGHAFVMEVNPRLAGGFIPELVRHAHGIDLIRDTLRLVVGEQPRIEPCRRQSASIRFFMPRRAGRLGSIEGLEAAREAEGVTDVALYRAIGDELSLRGDFRDRVGHVIACGPRSDVAAARASRARDMVRMRIVDRAREARLGAPEAVGVAAWTGREDRAR